MKNLFCAHPNSVGETYTMHLWQASRFSARLLLAGVVCLVHALLPFLFVKTASRAVDDLHERMVVNRSRRPAAHDGRDVERDQTLVSHA
jgi:hypothetical protein